MKVSIVTEAPASEPITLDDAKRQLKIVLSDTSYDDELTPLITDARQWIERRYGLSIITQKREQRQDEFYSRLYPRRLSPMSYVGYRYPIRLLYPPVQTVESVKYIDTDGNEQTLAANTDYRVAGLMAPIEGAQDIIVARLYPVNSWPTFRYIPEAITIEYTCGYGDDPENVPSVIKRGILMVLTHFFEYRSEEITGERLATFSMTVDRVMSSYEVFEHIDADW